MEEGGGSSWIGRARFSHTTYHRYDRSSSLDSIIPLSIDLEETLSLRRKGPEAPFFSKKSVSLQSHPQIQFNPFTNKQRSVSPLPQITVPDTFKEAQSEQKRPLTPRSRRKDVAALKPTIKSTPNSSPIKDVAELKLADRQGRKDSAWSNCFDHGGGKVTAVEAADEYLIDLSQLFLGRKFAYGAHSNLHHGVYKDEHVAVKLIAPPDDDENKALKARLEKQFNKEVALLCRLYHPNVIKFVAAGRVPPVFCIVTEFLSEGSLRSYLHKLEHKTLPMKTIVAFALDIARGMEYIHSQGVIHRDLKPENVLINEAFHMNIADFGIACYEANCDPFADDPGTYRWMAPEMIKRKAYGRKVDVYSFGLILWEMVSGSIPFENMLPVQVAYAVINKNLRPSFPKDCPPVMQALIEQCWSSEPVKRPEFWQIVKVLEQFESSVAISGTLKLVQNVTFQDRNKGLLHWIQKLSPTHSSSKWNLKFG